MFEDGIYQFQPFSPLHLAVVASIAGVIAWAIAAGRRWRGTPQLKKVEQAIAGLCLGNWIMFYGWRLLPAQFDLARSLPIHLCDLLFLLVPLGLIRPWRRARALLYFLGIGFSLQGICTPDLQHGLASPWFWLFWLHHGVIVGAALYLVGVHSYRPNRQDFRWAVKAGLIYVACVFPLDVIWGLNYGYLGAVDLSGPSILDWLGPWPWRVGAMIALGWLGMALLLAPWEWARRQHLHWL